MNKNTSKAVGLVDLVLRLRQGERLTAVQVAERYGMSHRTANRWLLDIDLELLPLEFERGQYRKHEAAR